MRKLLMFLLLAISLAGCRDDIPYAVAANVVDGGLFMGQFVLKRDGRPPGTGSLDSSQLGRLNTWLEHHRDGWSRLLVSPPPPSFSIVLTHPDGTHTQVDLFDVNESWRHQAVIHAHNPANNGIRQLTTRDLQELFAVLQRKS